MFEIRSIVKKDIEDLKSVLDSIDLFPSEMLEEMISDYFNNPHSKDIWFTAVQNERPVSVAFCSPEKLTDGTYNLYAIGVHRDLHGQGIGKKMMEYLEKELKSKEIRILIVETSGTDEMALTRKFYEGLEYSKEAVIRDFWSEGDDKVIYWKKI